jgi:putative methyltransferase (TIGR04325 family)
MAYPASIFPDMDSAWEACRRMNSLAHCDTTLIESNFVLSLERRISDYPVLFWLEQIARETPLRVFDFGGGVGQTFYQYAQALPPRSIEHWTVSELPDVVERGIRKATEHGASSLRFTEKLSDCAEHNVFLAAGSFHYWEKDLRQLEQESHALPEHVLINRSPLRPKGKAYITIQTPGAWRVPCLVRTKQQLVSEFEGLGYRLVDDWSVPEKTLALPFFPDHTAPYAGMYFRRTTSVVKG